MRVVWITGRPSSGKTTLARRIVAALEEHGRRATLVDSDEVREAITPQPTYAPEERLLVYRAIAYVARRLAESGVVPIVAATAHEPALRAAARAIVPSMFLVHARCPLEVCEARDPKGLYRRARSSAHGAMPGIHVPWIEPDDADVIIDTDREVPRSAIESLLARV